MAFVGWLSVKGGIFGLWWRGMFFAFMDMLLLVPVFTMVGDGYWFEPHELLLEG